MSHNNVTTWTCDRCGRSVDVEHEAFPIGWHWLTSQLIGPKDTSDRTWEVCNGCYSQVERLLMNQQNVEAA